jgi:hypothetical protein
VGQRKYGIADYKYEFTSRKGAEAQRKKEQFIRQFSNAENVKKNTSC